MSFSWQNHGQTRPDIADRPALALYITDKCTTYPQGTMTSVNTRLILASSSAIRAKILQSAGLAPEIIPPRVDEELIIQSLTAEHASPRDIADHLAEAKARKISQQHPQALVLGCDQTLDLSGKLFQKPTSPQQATQHLAELQGNTHHLYSAAVLYHQGQPIWRHIGHARMTMRTLSPTAIQRYIDQTWPSIQHAVGCYKIEEQGVMLFSEIQGDTFTIQGIPLIPLINYLITRGDITL
jgi:septum formation protein